MNHTTIEVTNKLSGTNLPYVGMHATISYGSDSYPYEVIEVKTPKKIVVRSMDSKRIDKNGPYSEIQEYEYTSNPNGIEHVVSLRKDNKWKIEKSTTVVRLGYARMHRDPHF